MNICRIHQIVDVPDYRYENNCANLDYDNISLDANTKTISLLEAINIIGTRVSTLCEEKIVNTDRLQELAGIISDLSDLAVTTNAISYKARYLSGLLDGSRHHKTDEKL